MTLATQQAPTAHYPESVFPELGTCCQEMGLSLKAGVFDTIYPENEEPAIFLNSEYFPHNLHFCPFCGISLNSAPIMREADFSARLEMVLG